MPQRLLLFLSLFVSISLSAQTYTGRVIDADTEESLPFVNIVYNQKGNGTISNIDGFFNIDKSEIEFLSFSYVGYESSLVLPNQLPENQIFSLKEKSINLNEIEVFPGINPAHRIIKELVKNRDKHNPVKWDSYRFKSYDKLTFGILDKDDVLATFPDTLKTKQDSARYRFKKIIDSQHLFLLETASEKLFAKPDKEKENIYSSRVSGFKDPSFFTLATQLQSLTFYNDYVTLLGSDFLSPVSPNSWNKYLFVLTDTLITNQADTIFSIEFRPLKNKNFNGLKGVINVNTNGYAINSIRAESASDDKSFTELKIEQLYEQKNHQWFPKELNSELIYNNVEIKPSGADSTNFKLKGSGKTYLFDQQKNIAISKGEFKGATIEVQPNVGKPNKEIWDEYRLVELSEKDTCTYHVIDSLGYAEKFDQKLKLITALFNSKLRVGKTNILLDRIISYNYDEGLKLGFGIETNDSFSNTLKLGGYYNYGTLDQRHKFGFNTSINLNYKTESKLFYSLTDDKEEVGTMQFLEKLSLFSSENIRKLIYTQTFPLKTNTIGIEHRWSKFLKTRFFYSYIEYLQPLSLSQEFKPIDAFKLQKLGIKLRLSFAEKFYDSGKTLQSLGTKYPLIFLNLENGINNSGLTDYYSLELKLYDSFRFRNLGTSKICILGAIRDEAEYGNLFLSPPASADHLVSIYTENSFATMPMYEYFANRMAAIYWRHDFGSLIFKTRKFNPQISTAFNAGWGATNNNYENFKSFEKGYYEGGLLLRNLLNLKLIGLGVAGFYRFGPYHEATFKNNLAIKFTLDINL